MLSQNSDEFMLNLTKRFARWISDNFPLLPDKISHFVKGLMFFNQHQLTTAYCLQEPGNHLLRTWAWVPLTAYRSLGTTHCLQEPGYNITIGVFFLQASYCIKHSLSNVCPVCAHTGWNISWHLAWHRSQSSPSSLAVRVIVIAFPDTHAADLSAHSFEYKCPSLPQIGL